MENFLTVRKNGVIVEVVNLSKATMEQAKEFKTILNEHIDQGQLSFVIDLKMCEFIDSTFLSTLILSLKRTSAMGGDIKLVLPNNDIYSMFDSTGMFKVFQIYESVQDAVDSFNTG